MSDLQPKGTPITLGNQEYSLLFTLNVIDDFQDHFDAPIADMFEMLSQPKKQLKVIRFLLTRLINEAIDEFTPDLPHVEEKAIGRKIFVNDYLTIRQKILDAFKAGLPQSEDDVPNAQSA